MEPLKPTPSPPPGLAVVIVNYRSWPDVLRLVDSLAGSPDVAGGRSEIVVVDNASPGPVPPPLLRDRPGVRLLVRGENGGFSAGVNAGWRASGRPWLLVLNPDVVPEADLIARVIGRIDAYERRAGGPPGVVGFELRNPDGSPQPSVGVFPGLARTVREQFLPRVRRKYQPGWRLKAGPVDWVTGACMLVNARLLEQLGGMDEDFFLYYEEVALCRSARDRGWGVEYDPGLSLVHLRPLQNRAISPKMRVITRHSKLLYFRKHLPAWQFLALCVTVRAEALVRGAWCRARGQGGRARAWRSVGQVARLMRAGDDLRGRGVLALAEAVEEAAEDGEGPGPGRIVATAWEAPNKILGRSPGKRPLPRRKDGPA